MHKFKELAQDIHPDHQGEILRNLLGDLYWQDKRVLTTDDIAGGAATNLAVANRTGTTLDVTSDTGTDATIPAANSTQAGLLTAADKVTLDSISSGGPYQPLDSDLSDIAGLTPSNDDIIQRKGGVWTNRTPAQVKADLALTKSDVGLSNVDNTSDVNKPVSTAQAAADAAVLAACNAYADGLVVGLLDDRGNFDASGGAYPSSGGSGIAGAILKGDLWTISVGGTLPTGQVVTAGDVIRALVDTPGNTQANWAISENNFGYVAENSANKSTDGTMAANSNTLYPTQAAVVTFVAAQISLASVPDATETVKGKAELATEAETNAGVDDSRIVTPYKLLKWWENRRLIAQTITAAWTFLSEMILSDIAEPVVTSNKLYSVSGALKWAGKYVAQLATTLGNSQVVETNGSGFLISAAKGTAYNKDFGTGTSNVPEIGAALGNSSIVETNGSGKLITATKNTGYNKNTGTTSGTVAAGDDSRFTDSRYTKMLAYDRQTRTGTSTTAEEIVVAVEIVAGTIGNNDELEIDALWSMTAGASSSNKICKIYLNNANSLTGATAYDSLQSTVNANTLFARSKARIVEKNANNAQEGFFVAISNAGTYPVMSGAGGTVATSSYSTGSSIWVLFTTKKALVGDVINLNNYTIKLNKV